MGDPTPPGWSANPSAWSQRLPIPDAALGVFGYLLDAVTGAIGRRARWRTLPWMVIGFGLAVGLLGAVSILPRLRGHLARDDRPRAR